MALSAGLPTNGTMHRRKSSKDEDEENVLRFPAPQSPPATAPLSQGFTLNGPTPDENNGLAPPHTRSRVTSTPSIPMSQSFPGQPASAGPYRTTFSIPRQPPANGNASLYAPPNGRHQASPMRQSFSLPSSHARTRSVSGPFSPITPSPLASSFPSNQLGIPPSHKLHSSSTAPELNQPGSSPPENGIKISQPPVNNRRHSRLHSRNLSIYFPRPGSLPSTSIAEDGAQELDFGAPAAMDEGVPIPSASPGPGQRTFREGFTFGARPPSAGTHPMAEMSSSPGGASRRGHHHKHSLSHNFFSFLEPGAQSDPGELHTQPTPMPMSPWAPISPFPSSPSLNAEKPEAVHVTNGLASKTRAKSPIGKIRASPGSSTLPVCASVGQFALGAWLWITGQQVGSLSCTGLGYWVVFDAIGVALGHILPNYLARPDMRAETRRPYGNARIETVMTFAQSVYLIFTSVYVCKETLEHILLSSGEGHHHHHGDEVSAVFGIEFPIRLLFITFVSLLTTAITFNNHSKLVSTAGNHIPSLASLLPARSRYRASTLAYHPLLNNLLTNPYSLAPVLFASCVLFTAISIPPRQHRPLDLMLAGIETVVTFKLAYRAAVALGAVLLQTSPARGLAGGRMEAFLRAMREIERDDRVLHLPAPHIWQLTPSLALADGDAVSPYAAVSAAAEKAQGPAQSLVVTLELHVRHDLADAEVLRLTRWAWERCVHALHFGTRGGEGGEGEAEVTVGIVKG
ncbi:hypothetical protein TRAPUB_3224 [Trametes pubescens]|uniref:Uncharacterized protein n=1 Tax=Trametes pubescens TaxID=154538 RepID=A0A1M2VEC9_TRAPU|nr:hypothetical protein TRAPUB_3224 [Trametes pubescens]